MSANAARRPTATPGDTSQPEWSLKRVSLSFFMEIFSTRQITPS
jgi:hypothetical protein